MMHCPLPSFRNSVVSAAALAAALAAVLCIPTLPASAADEAETEFFEKRIRPVLVERCYECHNSGDKTEGGLAVDHRGGLLEGGDSGAAIVPGKPDDSLLLAAIRHAGDELRMPQGGPKLSDAVIADFTRWIGRGAVDPRDRPPTPDELAAATSWEAIRERRKAWWSFQPIVKPELPAASGRSEHPIDLLVFARLAEQGLQPAESAARRTLIRRATFALTGLPPTVAEIEEFLGDESPQAYERLVDRLLASAHFGERWARHWMDWFRFAESHGSEGDPAIPYAWRYRDYLIRALNDDIAYDQLVREHLAGDLLPQPRINRELAINESALGTAHLRMVQHGYAPTDALDEQVTFTDNQIDVVSKALLGLTVSCARCHNHKFDPIAQTDFYALYGILASCRPALVTVDLPERQNVHREELTRLKAETKQKLADAWRQAADDLPRKLQNLPSEWQPAMDAAAKDHGHPLHAWAALGKQQDAELAEGWQQLQSAWTKAAAERTAQAAINYPLRWDLTSDDYGDWFKHGNGLLDRPATPGEFHIWPAGDQAVANVYRAGAYSHLLSSKHNGVLTSPRFKIETDWLSLRVAGGQGARVRLVVRNYPRVPGLLYESYLPNSESFEWRHWDVRYWKGEWAHVEIATAADLPVEAKTGDSRSWFGIAEVIGRNEQPSPRDFGAPLETLVAQQSPASAGELAKLYAVALRRCIEHWAAGSISDDEAEFLGFWVRNRLLPNTLEKLPNAAPLVAEYRRLEAEIPFPTRSPGVLEGTVFDQPLFVRGDHKQPGEPVGRRFLEVFDKDKTDSAAYPKHQSGRLELAREITDPRNPLVARVIVNRLWHHLFGSGIVATTDNFGHLGAEPADGKLLDYLAARFVEDGWSIKRMLRLMATSQTFRQASRPAASSATKSIFAPFAVRRLEAESIRDAILIVSGQMDDTRFGPSVDGKSSRSSVYVRVQRNNLDPLLSAFDAPEPNTTRGVRDATNVPAQSLMMMNDPWIAEQARRWAERIARDASLADDDSRICRMYAVALGRSPEADELRRCREFMEAQDRQRAEALQRVVRLESEIARRRAQIAAILSPVREKMLAERKQGRAPAGLPQPIARWEFESDLHDSLGDLHATTVGAARLENGALTLDGASYAQTPPLPRGLKEKTLEAWLQLDDLEQRGGGVMSVETLGGEVFDAIVFGEQQPREWLAGSDFFRRTQSFAGPAEQAAGAAVHLAIVYRADGRIAGYRDGKPYGKAYSSGGPVAFEPGASHIVFGMRHSPAGGNKMLKGRILQAQLYDRALTGEEIAASAAAMFGSVSDEQVLAALSEQSKAEHDRLQAELVRLKVELKPYEPRDAWRPDAVRRWQDLAQAIFSLKEFIYLR